MRRVLVIEDDESFSDALAYMLRRQGFEVACPTGADALAALDRAGADLVLLDQMLCRPPGFEVCQVLREQSDVPVIMLTDSEVDTAAGLVLSADEYVSMPFSWCEPGNQPEGVPPVRCAPATSPPGSRADNSGAQELDRAPCVPKAGPSRISAQVTTLASVGWAAQRGSAFTSGELGPFPGGLPPNPACGLSPHRALQRLMPHARPGSRGCGRGTARRR